MPDAQNSHQSAVFNPIHENIGKHGNQLPRPHLPTNPAATRKHAQAVAGQQQLSSHLLGGNRVIDRDVSNDPADIGQRTSAPNNRQGYRGSGGGALNSPSASRSNQARTAS